MTRICANSLLFGNCSEPLGAGIVVLVRGSAQSTTVRLDVTENIRPVKNRNTGRIDGMVAMITAPFREIRREEFYGICETRGLLVLEP